MASSPDAAKLTALRATRSVHPRAAAVTDGVFRTSDFFDPRDLVDLEAIDLDVFDDVLAVNLRGTVLTLRAALPHLARGSSVVTVPSTASRTLTGSGDTMTRPA